MQAPSALGRLGFALDLGVLWAVFPTSLPSTSIGSPPYIPRYLYL